MEIIAEKPFSFSVLPYSTETLAACAHDFELPASEITYVNLDIAMSAVGTASCEHLVSITNTACRNAATKSLGLF